LPDTREAGATTQRDHSIRLEVSGIHEQRFPVAAIASLIAIKSLSKGANM
jgi:hypothetical protein